MVASESFSTTQNTNSYDENVNDAPTAKLQEAIHDYEDIRQIYNNVIKDKINSIQETAKSNDMISEQNMWDSRNIYKDRLISDGVLGFYSDTLPSDSNPTPLSNDSGMESDLNSLLQEANQELDKRLKQIKNISERGVSNIKANIQNIKKNLDNDNTGISSDVNNTFENPSSTNTMTQKETVETYKNNLDKQREEEKKILSNNKMYEGEYEDAILKRKSYRFQSLVFSIIFLIVVGLTIRALVTTESNAIETLILFLGIALAIYYIIEHVF